MIYTIKNLHKMKLTENQKAVIEHLSSQPVFTRSKIGLRFKQKIYSKNKKLKNRRQRDGWKRELNGAVRERYKGMNKKR